MVDLKICTSCKKSLPASNEYFALWNRSKDGYSSSCKKCKKEYDRKYVEKNKEKLKAKRREYFKNNKEKERLRIAKWKMENPEKVAAWLERTKEKRSESNKRYWEENKEYAKEEIKKWREENKERIRLYRKANRDRDRERERTWYKTEKGNAISRTITNRRRALKRKLPNHFSSDDWIKCLKIFKQSCAYCGIDNEPLEQEHVKPLSKGGGLVVSNIVPACRTCNASKGTKEFESWYRKYEKYSIGRESFILEYLTSVESRVKEGLLDG